MPYADVYLVRNRRYPAENRYAVASNRGCDDNEPGPIVHGRPGKSEWITQALWGQLLPLQEPVAGEITIKACSTYGVAPRLPLTTLRVMIADLARQPIAAFLRFKGRIQRP